MLRLRSICPESQKKRDNHEDEATEERFLDSLKNARIPTLRGGELFPGKLAEQRAIGDQAAGVPAEVEAGAVGGTSISGRCIAHGSPHLAAIRR